MSRTKQPVSSPPLLRGRPTASRRDGAPAADCMACLLSRQHDAVVLHDLSGTVLGVNQRALTLLGLEEADIIGHSVTALRAPDTDDAASQALKTLSETGAVCFEMAMVRAGGASFPAEIAASVVHIDGQPIVQGIIRDITARKQADRKLGWLASFPQLNPNPVIELHPDGRLSYLNPSAATAFPALELGALPEDRGIGASLRALPYVLGEAAGSETTLDADLGSRTFALHAARVPPTGCIRVYVLDTTARTEQRRALEEAKQEAEEMAHLKSALLANMSHEIRTPLTAILGFSEILVDEAAGRNRELAGLILEGGQRLLSTMDAVLDLAQLEGGTLELELTVEPIGARLETLLRPYRVQAEQRGLSLTLRPAGGPLLAAIDRGAFERLIDGLLSNAIKFTPSGGVTVAVGQDGSTVWVRVTDTGVGIDDDFLPHAFEAFTQESTGLSRQFEGNGLGLTLADRLARRMGGGIDIESTKGEGTTVTLRLPAAEPAASEPPPHPPTR